MSTTATTTKYERPPIARLLLRAVHESAHALAVETLGVGRVKAVTISSEHDGGGGHCFWSPSEDVPPAPDFRQMSTVLLWDWRTRALFEKHFIVAIIGNVATTVYGPTFITGYKAPDASELERENMLAELEAAGYGFVATGDEPTQPFALRSDDDRARELQRLGVTEERLEASYVTWLTHAAF